jgi:hypothetical protein
VGLAAITLLFLLVLPYYLLHLAGDLSLTYDFFDGRVEFFPAFAVGYYAKAGGVGVGGGNWIGGHVGLMMNRRR